MKLKNVRPMHCTKILNSMDAEYAGSTIYQTYITLGTMFKSAKLNGKIRVHPLDGAKFSKSTKAVDDLKVLTVEEQKKFLEAASSPPTWTPFWRMQTSGKIKSRKRVSI